MGLVVATGADENTNYGSIIVSDDDTYKVTRDSSDGTKLVLVLSTPAPAEEHKHCICGETHTTSIGDHTTAADVGFTPWLETTKLPDTKGNYYLTGNVTLDSYWKPKSGTMLCLNGYNIELAQKANEECGVICVTDSNSFTLADCNGEQGEYSKITHGKDAEGSKYPGRGVTVSGKTPCIILCDRASLTVNGGITLPGGYPEALTIDGQTGGIGRMTVTNNSDAACSTERLAVLRLLNGTLTAIGSPTAFSNVIT